MNRYSGYTATIQGVAFKQLASFGVRTGSSKDTIIPMGTLDPAAIPMLMASPGLVFGIHDLYTLLLTAGVSVSAGLNCSSGATVRFQLRSEGSTFSSGTDHVTLSTTKGFAYITGIQASQGSPAVAALEYAVLYDGTNAPIAINTGVDISGVTVPAFVAKYYMGPVYVNGSQVSGVTSVSVNPGIGYAAIAADGNCYPTNGAILSRQPSISWTMLAVDYVATIGSMFNASTPGTVAVYFAKGASGSCRVAYGTAAHAKFSLATGVWSPDNVSVTDNGDGTVTVSVQGTSVMAASVASAIP